MFQAYQDYIARLKEQNDIIPGLMTGATEVRSARASTMNKTHETRFSEHTAKNSVVLSDLTKKMDEELNY